MQCDAALVWSERSSTLRLAPPPRPEVGPRGVVLCQPLGIEAICVYFSYRPLADRLAQLGLAVLRFDYDGTGDSGKRPTPVASSRGWAAWPRPPTSGRHRRSGRSAWSDPDGRPLCGQRSGPSRRGGCPGPVGSLPVRSSFPAGTAFLRAPWATTTKTRRRSRRRGSASRRRPYKDFADLGHQADGGPLAHRALVLVPPGRSRPPVLEHRLERIAGGLAGGHRTGPPPRFTTPSPPAARRSNGSPTGSLRR